MHAGRRRKAATVSVLHHPVSLSRNFLSFVCCWRICATSTCITISFVSYTSIIHRRHDVLFTSRRHQHTLHLANRPSCSNTLSAHHRRAAGKDSTPRGNQSTSIRATSQQNMLRHDSRISQAAEETLLWDGVPRRLERFEDGL